MKMTRALSRKFHEAKARKRMALPTPDYPPLLDYDKPIKEITVKDFRTNECHVFTLFHSKRRRDMWRVVVDDREWSKNIGYSRIMEGIRKAR